MNCDTDNVDFHTLFSGLASPVCVLEPVLDEQGFVSDAVFRHVNGAFLEKHKRSPERVKVLHFLCEEGFDGHNFLAALGDLHPGETKSFSITTAEKINWFECTAIRSTTGNFLLAARCTPHDENRESEKFENIFLPIYTGGSSILLIVDPAEKTIQYASDEAERFYGYPRAKLRGMPIDDIIIDDGEREEAFRASTMKKGDSSRHRLADGRTVEIREWTFVSQWNKKTAIFIVVDKPGLSASPTPSSFRPLYDRLGTPVDPKAFDIFLETLEGVPYLRELIAMLIPHGTLVQYSRGDHFLEHGAVPTTAGFILKGLFRQYTLLQDGQDCTLAFYRAAALIGNYPDFRMHRPNGVAFEARSDSLIFCVDMEILLCLARKDYRWYQIFFYSMCNRHIHQHECYYSLRCEDAVSRYRRFLLQFRDIAPFVKSYHIASFLGITSETLSRVRKTLAKAEAGADELHG